MFAPDFEKGVMKYSTTMSFRHILTAVFSVFLMNFAVAQEAETKAEEAHPATAHEEAGEKKFDAGEMIIEHITDSHDWHLWGEGHSSVAIPLPVILYTDKGLDFFMSSKFEHGHEKVEGKYTYALVGNEIKAANADGTYNEEAKIYDLSITKNVATLFIVAGLLLVIFLSVAAAYKKNPNKAPSGLQSFMEPFIIFIRDDIAKQSIGPKYEKFMPYLLTVFFFIWFSNMLGLVPFPPGGANLTGNIAVTMVLACLTFIIILLNGNKHYWGHILAMPGVPKPVLLILTPIEIMGVFLRPFVLMIRLFANITAGHIIALAFLSLIFIFGEMNSYAGLGVSVLSVAFDVFMGLMEVLVALIQAYVFTLLSAIYFGAAVEEAHH